MKITIIRDDAMIGVDGVFRKVDVSDLDPNIHAIAFDAATQKGNVKYNDTKGWKNVLLNDFALYQVYVDRWTAAAPPPPPPPIPPTPSSAKVAAQAALVSVQALPSVQADVKTLLVAIVNGMV